jgi:hypothetical protein
MVSLALNTFGVPLGEFLLGAKRWAGLGAKGEKEPTCAGAFSHWSWR